MQATLQLSGYDRIIQPIHFTCAGPPPLLVKVAPDLAEADKADVAAVALKLGVDGLVVSNTTITRPPEVAAHRHGGEVRLPRGFLRVLSWVLG